MLLTYAEIFWICYSDIGIFPHSVPHGPTCSQQVCSRDGEGDSPLPNSWGGRRLLVESYWADIFLLPRPQQPWPRNASMNYHFPQQLPSLINDCWVWRATCWRGTLVIYQMLTHFTLILIFLIGLICHNEAFKPIYTCTLLPKVTLKFSSQAIMRWISMYLSQLKSVICLTTI